MRSIFAIGYFSLSLCSAKPKFDMRPEDQLLRRFALFFLSQCAAKYLIKDNNHYSPRYVVCTKFKKFLVLYFQISN